MMVAYEGVHLDQLIRQKVKSSPRKTHQTFEVKMKKTVFVIIRSRLTIVC